MKGLRLRYGFVHLSHTLPLSEEQTEQQLKVNCILFS